MRVLVVEDHPRLAETVATVLRREGMAVDVAFDGREALGRVALADYDVTRTTRRSTSGRARTGDSRSACGSRAPPGASRR